MAKEGVSDRTFDLKRSLEDELLGRPAETPTTIYSELASLVCQRVKVAIELPLSLFNVFSEADVEAAIKDAREFLAHRLGYRASSGDLSHGDDKNLVLLEEIYRGGL